MYKCKNFVAAVLIIVFSLWQTMASKWIVVISALVILTGELYLLRGSDCSFSWCSRKTGGRIFSSVKRGRVQKVPSEKEVKETLK